MSNSSLINYTKISPNKNSPRADIIKKIAIHHTAGVLSVETIGNIFSGSSRSASANYGIGADGRIGMYVEEKDRSWCTSSGWCDNQAITIECSNSATGGDWPVSDLVLNKLVALCVDVCERNGIPSVTFTGDKNGTLQMHKWYAATACPGPYLASKFQWIAEQINTKLSGGSATGGSSAPTPTDVRYRVQVGAFGDKSNADRMADKLKADGFATYMVKFDNLYKVQTGAFAVKSNADALANTLKAKGYDTYITTQKGEPVGITIDYPKVGDKVKVRQGATTYTGDSLASFVYQGIYDLQELSGTRAVIGINGRVTAAVDIKDLTRV